MRKKSDAAVALARYDRFIRDEEAEACAQIADATAVALEHANQGVSTVAARGIARDIRARIANGAKEARA